MSEQKALILRIAETLYRFVSQMGNVTVERLLDVTHSANFELNVFRSLMQSVTEYRELSQREADGMIMENGLEKKILKKTVGGVRGEAVYYMPDVRVVLREQEQLAYGPSDMMFRPEHIGGMDRSWEGHTIRRMYLRAVYSALSEEVMQNVNGDVFWSEWSEGL